MSGIESHRRKSSSTFTFSIGDKCVMSRPEGVRSNSYGNQWSRYTIYSLASSHYE